METYLYKFLKKKCEEKGFFYSQLEDKADLSHSVVQAIRNGRTQLKPGTKQKLAQALGCSIGDIQDAIRRSDEVLEDGEVLKKHVPEEPATIPEPEPHCPYDDPEPEKTKEERMLERFNEMCINHPGPGNLSKKNYNDEPKEPAAGPQDKPWIPEKEMPEYPKENPEATEATVIQQLANDVIREEQPATAKMVKAAPPRFDNVNHPSHYTQGAVECIEGIKASMTAQQFLGYLKGNAVKYLWRFQFKGGVEDLRKARWYLDRLIAEVDR